MTSEQPPAPLPSGAASSSGSGKGKNGTGAMLVSSPAALVAFIAHLHRCMQTPSGIDTVLLFIAFSSRLSASALDAVTRTALRRRIATLLLAMPARGSVVVTPPTGAAKALATSARLRALAAL